MKKREDGRYEKFPQFTPDQEMYVFHNEVGRVLDISMGGVTFTYIADNRPPEDFPPEGMLFTTDGTYIHDIPFARISDHVHGCFFSDGYCTRERRIRFGALSPELARQLEGFILENAHIPQRSHAARHLAYTPDYVTTGGATHCAPPQQGRRTEHNSDVQLARCSAFSQG